MKKQMRSEDIIRKRLVVETVVSKMIDTVRVRLLLINIHLFTTIMEI